MKKTTLLITISLFNSCSYLNLSKKRSLASEDEDMCSILPIARRFVGSSAKTLDSKEIVLKTADANECYKKAIDSIKDDFKKTVFRVNYGLEIVDQPLLAQQLRRWSFNSDNGTVSKRTSKDFRTGSNVIKPSCYVAPSYYTDDDRRYTDETQVEIHYSSSWQDCYQNAIRLMKKMKPLTKKMFLSTKYPLPSYKSFRTNVSVKWGYRIPGLLNDRSGYIDETSLISEPRSGDIRKGTEE